MRLTTVAFVLLGLLAPGALLHAAGDPPTGPDQAVIVVGNPTLRASLDRIYRNSALWRAELERVASTGRRIVVLTSDQVSIAPTSVGGQASLVDDGLLAEVSIVVGEGTRVDAVLVAVNLRLLDQAHQERGLPWSHRDADLDRILVHEVYGHALPYILAGDQSGRCADPALGQRATDACAIRRENAVRAELGLGQRTDPGLLSLAVARGF
jgi:hypothetical protein